MDMEGEEGLLDIYQGVIHPMLPVPLQILLFDQNFQLILFQERKSIQTKYVHIRKMISESLHNSGTGNELVYFLDC
jgi:hypothetical protein